ncbi:MAG: hypothetical protein QM652_12630 [Legionella sp.]|uniref:hypothetical protein n=1 Tax=Legionella sp. TaxID=459 RepID=UPI0039E4FFAF
MASALEEKALASYNQALKQIQIGLEETINTPQKHQEWLTLSDFVYLSLESLRPKSYLGELKKEIEKQDVSPLFEKPVNHSTKNKNSTYRTNNLSKVNNENILYAKVISPIEENSNLCDKKKDSQAIIATIKNLIPSRVQLIINELQKKDYKTYVAGGAVRDTILGRDCSDIDIVSEAPPPIIAEIAKKLGEKFQIISVRKPIVRIMDSTSNKHYDFATLEGEPEKRNYPVLLDNGTTVYISLGKSLLKDAMKRDLPINSMYVNLFSNTIEDPTGRGWNDLSQIPIILQTNIDPVTSFEEDSVRMLRTIYLQVTLGGSIEPYTEAAIFQCQKLLVSHSYSPMRVLQWLHKLLINDKAHACLNVLNKYELLKFFGREQSNQNMMSLILKEIETKEISASETNLRQARRVTLWRKLITITHATNFTDYDKRFLA